MVLLQSNSFQSSVGVGVVIVVIVVVVVLLLPANVLVAAPTAAVVLLQSNSFQSSVGVGVGVVVIIVVVVEVVVVVAVAVVVVVLLLPAAVLVAAPTAAVVLLQSNSFQSSVGVGVGQPLCPDALPLASAGVGGYIHIHSNKILSETFLGPSFFPGLDLLILTDLAD